MLSAMEITHARRSRIWYWLPLNPTSWSSGRRIQNPEGKNKEEIEGQNCTLNFSPLSSLKGKKYRYYTTKTIYQNFLLIRYCCLLFQIFFSQKVCFSLDPDLYPDGVKMRIRIEVKSCVLQKKKILIGRAERFCFFSDTLTHVNFLYIKKLGAVFCNISTNLLIYL
jgi:hypothetical protein